MRYTTVSELLAMTPPAEVCCAGWVRTKRETKGLLFLEINDGSSQGSLQLITSDENLIQQCKPLSTGASASFSGTLKESPAKGQRVELHFNSVEILGTADPENYPLQKKQHSFEFLREIAHLRPRTNTFGAMFRLRSRAAFIIHRFFQQQGFFYVNTPIITANDCEGAGEMFGVSTLSPDEFRRGEADLWQSDFFGTRASLTVSGQLEGELLASALGKIYTFGPTFRAENSNTSRHLSEFWMVEPEASFNEIGENMDLAEAFLKYLFTSILAECPGEMEFFDTRIRPGIRAELEKLALASFERITYTEAVDILLKSDEKFEYPVSWGADLQSEHERYLVEKKFKSPVIVTDYPREIKAFYMYCNDDEKTVRGMDVLVPGVGEIIGGSQREHRLDVLLSRMQQSGLDEKDYWWYLDTRRFGSVPHSGFGLGFERVLQYVSGMENIRDVIPFPRTPKHLMF